MRTEKQSGSPLPFKSFVRPNKSKATESQVHPSDNLTQTRNAMRKISSYCCGWNEMNFNLSKSLRYRSIIDQLARFNEVAHSFNTVDMR